MSQTGFEIDWLNERFRFDNAARNKKVEQAFLEFASTKQNVILVDIGAGTGANCIYFVDKIPQNQNWLLVERDTRFLTPTIERLNNFASQKGYDIELGGHTVLLKKNNKIVEIQVINDSFFRLENLVDLKNVDVVLAAAVFDLLSENQLKSLVKTLFDNRCALLATMNYAGMTFHPEIKIDRDFISVFEAHMNREQAFGRGLGKNVIDCLDHYFDALKSDYFKGESNWKLTSRDRKMHDFLFGFLDDSIHEMLQVQSDKNEFEAWLNEKRKNFEKHFLTIEVSHFDYFISS